MSSSRVILRLLGILKPYFRALVLSVLSGFATIAASVGLMATAAYLISAAALHPSIAELQVAIVGVRFFGLSRGVFRYLERLLSHGVNLSLLAGLRVWLYQHIEPLAPAGLTDRQGGDLVARLVSDINNLENFYVRVVAPLAVAGLVGLGMAFFLASYSPLLAAVLLAALVAIGVGLPLLFQQASRTPARHLVDLRARLGATLVDGIQGSPELLAFGQQDTYLEHLAEDEQELARVQNRMACFQAVQTGLGVLGSSLGGWGLLVLAIPLVSSGALPGIVLAAVVLGGLASFEAVLPLPLALQYLEASVQSARRLFEIADQSPIVVDPPTPASLPGSADVIVRNLSFSYPGTNQPALGNIDLDLPAGKRLALVGPSGAGKTSLTHLLLRFWEPYEGEICLGGVDTRKLSAEAVRSRFAVIAQSTILFNATIRQNLLIARPGASTDDLYAAARQAQVHDFFLSLPEGYETWIGESGLRLSAGERQRLAIARALLKDAPILILDEPTANLDASTAQALMDTILGPAFRDRSLLLITHRLTGLESIDEILVMDHGCVVERGPHGQLLAHQGLYARLYALQHGGLIE